jgi:hypothetical protein
MSTYPDDEDGAVLADLAERGLDMTQPLAIDFFVAAPDEAAAEAIAQALGHRKYEVQIVYDEGEPDEDGNIDPDDDEFGPSWTVYVNKQMVPEYSEIVRIKKELDVIAQPLGGHADGWGVMVDG